MSGVVSDAVMFMPMLLALVFMLLWLQAIRHRDQARRHVKELIATVDSLVASIKKLSAANAAYVEIVSPCLQCGSPMQKGIHTCGRSNTY